MQKERWLKVWGVFFNTGTRVWRRGRSSITEKIKHKRRGANTQEERGKKDAGLRLKQLLSLALCVVHMRSRKKKKSSSHPQMANQSNANVKRTHMTARAPVKKSTAHREHDGFTDGYMCRGMMESPSQMSLYHLVFRDKTICVC